MNNTVTFITSNPNKLAQLQQFTQIALDYQNLDLPEIQSLDLYEIVTLKAQAAFNEIRKPLLVEDVSLVISALGKLPGPFIKWFLKELKPEGICNLIKPNENRSAQAELCYAYHDGKQIYVFTGAVMGKIALEPMGANGFGWDQIFIPDGYAITRAQMGQSDYEKTSPRKMALSKFEVYLKKHV